MIIEQTEIKYKGKVVFERLVMDGSVSRVPKLFVEQEACFLYLTKGAFIFRTPTNLLSFKESDGMLAKCGNYFFENASLNKKAEHQVVSVVGAFFYPSVVKSFFQSDLSIKQLQSSFDAVKINIEPLMKSFMDSLNFMLDNPEIADENLIITKLKELLLLLSKSEQGESITDFVNSLFVFHEYNFNEIIQQNLYTNLSLPEFAHLSSMSLATFKRKFQDYYKQSPAKYILLKKLEKSLLLLAHKTKSVSEIAYETGFESVSNFDKAFKKHYGKSPTEYRLSQNDN
jgi:AraC family transcriptional regulator, exoenzyme S synthesis regulatory protein ExsA